MDDLFPFIPHYEFRLTSTKEKEEVYKLLKGIAEKPVKKINYMLLCVSAFEVSKQGVEHTHNYLITDMPVGTLRTRIRETFLCSGNEQYKISKITSPSVKLAYVIKEGNYIADDQFIEVIPTIKPWVYQDSSFEESYALLKDSYLSSDMSDYDFVYRTVGLYAEHKKHIYISHIRASWLGVANQRNQALNAVGHTTIVGNSRPFRNRLVEEIMRGFYICDN